MDSNDNEEFASPVSVAPSSIDEVEAEWSGMIRSIPDRIRSHVAEIVQQHASELSSHFYHAMMADARASAYLDHSVVEARLNQAMQQWLINLFTANAETSVLEVAAQQRRVGDGHARIKIPIQLVSKGARYLKHWIWEFLASDPRPVRDELTVAVTYVNDLFDLALEEMNTSFVSNNDRVARADEGYRLFSLSQDLAIERERQRAALAEWNQQVVNSVYREPGTKIVPIGQSEFGLWLVHKAQFIFEQSPEMNQLKAIIEHIDSEVIACMANLRSMKQISSTFTKLDSDISEIKFLLSTLFDRYLEIENGRDVLTKLLNRRFLPSAMRREIDLAQKVHHKFAVLLIDVDRFKQVNDTYGHDAGDAALQQIALLIMNSVRSSDFIFRFGGEEILIILVDVDQKAAAAIAENIRAKVEQNSILLSGNRNLQVTVSIGISVYDGHPDYKIMITRADSAVYEAKNSGRNRCVLAE